MEEGKPRSKEYITLGYLVEKMSGENAGLHLTVIKIDSQKACLENIREGL